MPGVCAGARRACAHAAIVDPSLQIEGGSGRRARSRPFWSKPSVMAACATMQARTAMIVFRKPQWGLSAGVVRRVRVEIPMAITVATAKVASMTTM